jgi:hypothetical protein
LLSQQADVKMLRSSAHLRSLLRYSQTAAAAQLQQQRFLNVHEYQVGNMLSSWKRELAVIRPLSGSAAVSTAADTLAPDTVVHFCAAAAVNSTTVCLLLTL